MIHCTNQDPDLRLLVECHSDVLLLRLRRRVAEGLDPNRIGVLYVDQADDGASTLREIKLNTRGVPDWWPSGVFEEAPQEYLAMRRHLSRHVP
jgi:predicted ATPase